MPKKKSLQRKLAKRKKQQAMYKQYKILTKQYNKLIAEFPIVETIKFVNKTVTERLTELGIEYHIDDVEGCVVSEEHQSTYDKLLEETINGLFTEDKRDNK
jgi:hypothetical protein